MKIAPAWQSLSLLAARLCEKPLRELIAEDASRPQDFALRVGAIYGNFSRQRYDRDALAALFALAQERQVPKAVRDLFAGAEVNASERRPALHTALRSNLSNSAVAQRAHADALAVRGRMSVLVAQLESSDVTDIINVGIGDHRRSDAHEVEVERHRGHRSRQPCGIDCRAGHPAPGSKVFIQIAMGFNEVC